MRCAAPTGGMTRIARAADKRAQRDDGISPRLQPIDDLRKRSDCLGSVTAGVVQKNDTAVVALLLDALKNDVRARSRPILRVDILEHDKIVHLVCDPKRSKIG